MADDPIAKLIRSVKNPSPVEREARRIHRCPPGYAGPCWGPTFQDLEQAARSLGHVESLQDKEASDHG